MAPAPDAPIASSHLQHLGRMDLDRLMRGSRREVVPAGGITHREGATEVHLELVLEGLSRVFVSAPDGRTMTVRYCRPGAILGAFSLYRDPFVMPATVQCLVDTTYLIFDAAHVRRMADADATVARVLLAELSERVSSFVAEIPGSAFASVRQRVARHVLDLASEGQEGTRLVAGVSQQELADAVGTAREVVVRILREFRALGIVETSREAIAVLDAVALLRQTYPGPWDRGSHVDGT